MGSEILPNNQWGTALWDDEAFPCMDYFPAPPGVRKERRAACATDFVAGNSAIKLLCSGSGVCFPYVLAVGSSLVGGAPGTAASGRSGTSGLEWVVSLCGDARDASRFGGGRLFLIEGGLARAVVGPDDEQADSSEVLTASLRFSPNWVEKRCMSAGLAVTQRLALPLSGTPALLLLYVVENRDQGVRWLNLCDVWDFVPWAPSFRPVRPPLQRRLASALGFSRAAALDNSYFGISCTGEGSRVEVAVSQLPPVQVMGLTRNVQVEQRDRPSGLGARAPTLDKGIACARVCLEAKFQLKPGETQVGGGVLFAGGWEEARAGLRSVLPLNMFVTNEGLIWKRRRKFLLESTSPHGHRSDEWESAWRWGLARSAPWKNLATGEWAVPPGGRPTFLDGALHDWRAAALAVAVLAYGDPKAAADLLSSMASRVTAVLKAFPEASGPFPVDDVAWFAWGLGEYMAAVGDADAVCLGAPGPVLLAAVADFLSKPELFGPSGLPSTAFADRCGLVHDLEGVPARKSGTVESVAAGAHLVAALEGLAGQMGEALSPFTARFSGVAASCRAALERLYSGTSFPRWLWKGRPAGSSRVFLDHHLWLLIARLPSEMEQEILSTLARTLLGVTPAGVPTMDGRFEEPGFKLRSGGGATDPMLSPIMTALLLEPLARLSPETARSLCEGLGTGVLLAEYPSSFQMPFLTPAEMPLAVAQGPTGTQRPSVFEGAGSAEWTGSLCAALARLKILGIRGVDGGLAVQAGMLEHFSLATPTLSVSLSGSTVRGEWTGTASHRKIVVHSGRPGGSAVEVNANRGERWSVQRG